MAKRWLLALTLYCPSRSSYSLFSHSRVCPIWSCVCLGRIGARLFLSLTLSGHRFRHCRKSDTAGYLFVLKGESNLSHISLLVTYESRHNGPISLYRLRRRSQIILFPPKSFILASASTYRSGRGRNASDAIPNLRGALVRVVVDVLLAVRFPSSACRQMEW